MNKEFSRKMKEIRNETGLTLLEIAQELNVSETTVSRWENAKAEPNIDKLKKLARILEVTVDELVDF